MMRAGHLRHGGAHRKQAAHLRVKLAPAQVWHIRIPEAVTDLFALRSTRRLGITIPAGARIDECKDPSTNSRKLVVTTTSGTLLTVKRPLPHGISAERIL